MKMKLKWIGVIFGGATAIALSYLAGSIGGELVGRSIASNYVDPDSGDTFSDPSVRLIADFGSEIGSVVAPFATAIGITTVAGFVAASRSRRDRKEFQLFDDWRTAIASGDTLQLGEIENKVKEAYEKR